MLALKGVNKSFSNKDVVKSASFEVADGEVLALLGPSGCGKTTIVRMIAGLEKPDSGHIFLNGKDLTKTPVRDRNAALVFQNFSLYPNKSVLENIASPLRVRKHERSFINTKVREISRSLEIEDILEAFPANLSGGEKQRVSLARALVRDPSVFLLDEPLSSLDVRLRSSLREKLRETYERLNAPIIHVTHDQTEAFLLSDRVAVMLDGSIRQIGKPQELLENPVDLQVAEFVGQPSINFLPINLIFKGLSKICSNSIRYDKFGVHTLGIRPWHIEFSKGDTTSVTLDCIVKQCIDVGPYDWVSLTPVINSASQITACSFDKGKIKSGMTVQIYCPITRSFIFDQSGTRIKTT